jgi:hypothetical protein
MIERFFTQFERRMCLAAYVSEFQSGQPFGKPMDDLVQS